ncbi:MAG: 3-hydroxyacyl-CoA dehydrogenase family protein [Pseudomonadota bacterium]
MPQSKYIAVLGAGPTGHGIAQLFAAKGHEVVLFDLSGASLSAAMGKIESNLRFLARNGMDEGRDFSETMERIRLSSNLQEAVSEARFVVETSAEDLKIKQALFRELEAYCSPFTVIAAHTRSLGISDIVADMKVKNRVVGTCFWFPPCLIPLVEVMGSRHTFPEVTDYVCNLLLLMGMRPVVVNRETPGFIGHRLQQALLKEAMVIVDQGIAAQADVDEVARTGIGLHLSALGLFGNGSAADEELPGTGQELSLMEKILAAGSRSERVRQHQDSHRE